MEEKNKILYVNKSNANIQMTQQILLLLGGFAIAYNIAIAFHEFGHTIAVIIDGGQTQEYVLNPFSWSWNLGQNVSNLTFTAWGGVTFGLLFAFIPILFIIKIRTTGLVFLCKLIAAKSTMSDGNSQRNWKVKRSAKSATYAKEWGEHLANSGCNLEHRPYKGKWKQLYGENLYRTSGARPGPSVAVDSWGEEKKTMTEG